MKFNLDYFVDIELVEKNARKPSPFSLICKSDFEIEEKIYDDQIFVCDVKYFFPLWNTMMLHSQFNTVPLSYENGFKHKFSSCYKQSNINKENIINSIFQDVENFLFKNNFSDFVTLKKEKYENIADLYNIFLLFVFNTDRIIDNNVINNAKTIVFDGEKEIKSRIEILFGLLNMDNDKIYFSPSKTNFLFEDKKYFDILTALACIDGYRQIKPNCLDECKFFNIRPKSLKDKMFVEIYKKSAIKILFDDYNYSEGIKSCVINKKIRSVPKNDLILNLLFFVICEKFKNFDTKILINTTEKMIDVIDKNCEQKKEILKNFELEFLTNFKKDYLFAIEILEANIA